MNGDAATSAADLAFRARALAQTHPFSAAAYRIVNSAATQESRVQNPAEAGVWAAAAFTQGYCLRRVQETAEDVDVQVVESATDEALACAASEVALRIREGDADDETTAALDLLVGSQVGNRVEQWSDDLNPNAVAELEQYLTWWVVKGYALRQAETTRGSRACES